MRVWYLWIAAGFLTMSACSVGSGNADGGDVTIEARDTAPDTAIAAGPTTENGTTNSAGSEAVGDSSSTTTTEGAGAASTKQDSSSTAGPKPSQTLRLTWTWYSTEVHEFTDRVTVENYQGDHIYQPDVESVEAPDAEVTIESVGPADVCQREGAGIRNFSGWGTACEIRLRAAETDDYAATDFTMVVANNPAAHVAWTLRDGPPFTACFNTAASIPDIVIEIVTFGLVEGGGVAPSGVTMGLSIKSIVLPEGQTASNPYGLLSLDTEWSDPAPDRQIQVYSPVIDPALPSGSVVNLEFTGLFPGMYFVSFDDPLRFSWTFDDTC